MGLQKFEAWDNVTNYEIDSNIERLQMKLVVRGKKRQTQFVRVAEPSKERKRDIALLIKCWKELRK